MGSHDILEREQTSLAGVLKAFGEQTQDMNVYYESIFLQVLVKKVLYVVAESTGSGCDRFGEGRKTIGHMCQEFLFAFVKCLRFGEVHSPCRLQEQNYQDNRTQVVFKATRLGRITSRGYC